MLSHLNDEMIYSLDLTSRNVDDLCHITAASDESVMFYRCILGPRTSPRNQ